MLNGTVLVVVGGAAQAETLAGVLRPDQGEGEALEEARQPLQLLGAEGLQNRPQPLLLELLVLLDQVPALGARGEQDGAAVAGGRRAGHQAEPLQLVDVLGRSGGAHAEEVRHLSDLMGAVHRDQLQEVELPQAEGIGAHLVEQLDLQDLPHHRGEDVRVAEKVEQVARLLEGLGAAVAGGLLLPDVAVRHLLNLVSIQPR